MALSPEVRRDVEILWDFHVLDSGSVVADVLIILGSHDVRVADRGAELYVAGKAAPLAIVTGGAGKVTGTEWTRTEGDVYAERLILKGVPEGSILVETKATNTGDNFGYSRELAKASGYSIESGIIVSKPYMARRSLATAMKVWPDVSWYTRPPQIPLLEYPNDEVPLDRMINLMVGDLQRLKVYAEKGFQAYVDIPMPVWRAYERLADEGFDKFVIKG
ncbi:MAG TPA: YdcF family protein [Streptosporangiaceae bacterium]|nr:YdcF family protein [Streptosporangiaceae bacterium]